MADNENVGVVDDFDAIMRSKAGLSKGMVDRMQASAMEILKACKKRDAHGIHECYPEWGQRRMSTQKRIHLSPYSQRYPSVHVACGHGR